MGRASNAGGRQSHVVVVRGKTILCAFLLVIVIALISSNQFWRWMYPIGYQSLIQQAAHQADVDPLLVASVIRVESKFRTEDVSHAGAVGLMQLMPSTAKWIAGQMQGGGADTNTMDLARPSINIGLGAWYIRYLTVRFSGNEVAAVAAYNAGQGRVQQWLNSGIWNGQLSSIVTIPVGETRHFVDRVFYNYTLYKRIYGADPAWQHAE